MWKLRGEQVLGVSSLASAEQNKFPATDDSQISVSSTVRLLPSSASQFFARKELNVLISIHGL